MMDPDPGSPKPCGSGGSGSGFGSATLIKRYIQGLRRPYSSPHRRIKRRYGAWFYSTQLGEYMYTTAFCWEGYRKFINVAVSKDTKNALS
jgi:hypothetical protein